MPGRNSAFRCGTLLALGFTVLVGCTGMQTAGSVSETTNGAVAGALYNEQGDAAEGTRVLLLPAGYDPVKGGGALASATTDAEGNYSFTDVTDGDYTVFATNDKRGTNVSITGLHVGDGNDTIAPDTLRSPGSVSIMFAAKDATAPGYVYIPGTLLFRYVGTEGGVVTLDSVPAGVTKQLLYADNATSEATVIRYNVTVVSRETTPVWNTTWRFSRNLTLNTSVSGADIAGTVTGFPVLIRLNEDNFDFTQCAADGSDIRFSASDSVFLSCEIGRWDWANQRAEFWVKVDTIRGSDSTQAISLYWGNPQVAPAAGGASVFDTGNGFAGVWHLNETSGSMSAEATQNGLAGTYEGSLPNPQEGPIDVAQNIVVPDSDYVDVGDVLDAEMNNLSISVWVKRGLLVTPEALVAKTDGDLPSASYGYLLSIDPGNFPHFNIAAGGSDWGDDGSFDIAGDREISDSTEWHQVFVVIDRTDNANCRMFLDGSECTGARIGNSASVTAVNTPHSLRFGTENDTNASFSGAIDEPTIAFTVRSADWVKLCYMNQKPDDALVKW